MTGGREQLTLQGAAGLYPTGSLKGADYGAIRRGPEGGQ